MSKKILADASAVGTICSKRARINTAMVRDCGHSERPYSRIKYYTTTRIAIAEDLIEKGIQSRETAKSPLKDEWEDDRWSIGIIL